VKVTLGDASQASVTVGVVNTGVEPQAVVKIPDKPFKVGGVLSITVMVWLSGSETLPQASVALHVLFVA
jgi:hypothetical protein